MTVALWWARRDLRLTDNQALSAALAHAERVVPVFVLDPRLLEAPEAGDKRVAFLMGALTSLDADLRARGSRLVVRRGDPPTELARLVAETGAEAVYAEEDVDPFARQRDGEVARSLPLRLTGGLTVHPATAVAKTDGSPYTVFTPYSRRWKALPLPTAEAILPAPATLGGEPAVEGLPIPREPALSAEVPFPPSEAEAQRRLYAFTADERPEVYGYAQGRDRLDWEGTSRLSPYLRFGLISARQAVAGALQAREDARDSAGREGADIWLNELIWREFYQSILDRFPQVVGQSFRPELRDVAWLRDRASFEAWCQGRTGYPVVDAAMRQLVQTGWMHNRARMIVASFLVKDLLIDWRWGEGFFHHHLVDADLAANNGGWQWTAGTGTDAAPYFRVFNPVLQGIKFDPDGSFVRRWLPELAAVPDRFCHQPWKMSAAEQRAANCILDDDYPAPIVDHRWARERVLRAYSRARKEART